MKRLRVSLSRGAGLVLRATSAELILEGLRKFNRKKLPQKIAEVFVFKALWRGSLSIFHLEDFRKIL